MSQDESRQNFLPRFSVSNYSLLYCFLCVDINRNLWYNNLNIFVRRTNKNANADKLRQ